MSVKETIEKLMLACEGNTEQVVEITQYDYWTNMQRFINHKDALLWCQNNAQGNCSILTSLYRWEYNIVFVLLELSGKAY